MNEEASKQWNNLLDPEILSTNLKTASIYIAAYEILKDSIIGRLTDFFSVWSDDGCFKPTQDYKTYVLSRNKSPLYASLDWFREMDAISSDDLNNFEEIKQLRNELAHEMPRHLSQGMGNDFFKTFALMFEFLNKIETWWIVNMEIPVDSDFDGQTVEDKDVFSGRQLLLQMMFDVALGKKEDANKYLDMFNQEKPGNLRG